MLNHGDVQITTNIFIKQTSAMNGVIILVIP